MLTAVALKLLREGYRHTSFLAAVLFLLALSALTSPYLEASTYYPVTLLGYLFGAIALALFALYFFRYVRWISEYLGKETGVEEEVLPSRLLRIFLFFLLLSFLTFFVLRLFGPLITLLIWLLFMTYPVAVAIDDVSPKDNLFSTIETWRYAAPSLLEMLLLSTLLLLTAFFLEVNLGPLGVILSYLLTFFFTIPLATTLLALSYLLRYPLVRRVLGL